MSENFNPTLFDAGQDGYAYRFNGLPSNTSAFTEGEAQPLGRNLTQMRRKRQGRTFSWEREARQPSTLEKSQEELYLRFYETFGGMFTDNRTRRLMKALYLGEPGAYDFLSTGLHPQLRAALSPDDYPLLFGDTIDRVLLAKYRALPSDWRTYIKVASVMDFRDVKRFKAGRGGGILGVLKPGEAYKPDKPSESKYSYAVEKRGSVRNIFWEAMVNDDLGALAETPDDFAYRARQTEAYVATGFYCAAGGVNTNLYNAAHSFTTDDGVVSTYSNTFQHALTAKALAYVIGQMGNYPDDTGGGLPFSNDPIHIVVATREMQFKADQIVNSPTVMAVGSTDADNIPTINILPDGIRSRMQVHYEPMIRMWDTVNYQTRWFLFCDIADGHAVEVGFLQGYEDPQLFMRASAQLAMGGGLASPMMGDFDTDSVDYKIRMVIGGSSTEDVGGWRFTATSYDNGLAVP
jgi:hypothetical protein